MSDKDREAFEADYSRRWHGAVPVRDGDSYKQQKAQIEWRIWQAARDHYAPKLTEKEVIAIATGSIDGSIKLTCYEEGVRRMIAALRAAGVRWKEEP